MKAKCAWCSQIREIYATKEEDFEEGMTPNEDCIIHSGKLSALKEGDTIALPMCKECFESGQCA